jgi:hypothetical protein
VRFVLFVDIETVGTSLQYFNCSQYLALCCSQEAVCTNNKSIGNKALQLGHGLGGIGGRLEERSGEEERESGEEEEEMKIGEIREGGVWKVEGGREIAASGGVVKARGMTVPSKESAIQFLLK